MIKYNVHLTNTISEYGFISKLFHWLTALLLIFQIPLGFYLVDLDFGKERINFENIHVIIGLSIFYLAILRLLNNFFNPTPKIKTCLALFIDTNNYNFWNFKKTI